MLPCLHIMYSVGTLVLRLLQAAQARETRDRFDCAGGASFLGEAAGRMGRRGRAVALSLRLAGLDCCGCIPHETVKGQELLVLLASGGICSELLTQTNGSNGGFKSDPYTTIRKGIGSM
jgi:hypothetical protein